MGKQNSALSHQTTQKLFSTWSICIDSHESANFVFLPNSDRYYRVAQFIDKNRHKYSKDKIIHQINIQALNTDPTLFMDKINNMRPTPDTHQIFFVMDGEWVLGNNHQYFNQMRIMSYQPEPKDTFIITYETDPYIPEYEKIIMANQILCKNINRVPLYSEADIRHFINYFSNLLDIKLTESEKSDILTQCGGYIAFTSEIIRNYKLTGNLSYSHLSLDIKLCYVWNSFSYLYQQVLSAIANNTSYDSSLNPIKESLIIHKLIKNDGNKIRISVPLLEQFIKKTTHKTISFSNTNKLIFNGIVINDFNAKDIRILKFLINNDGIVKRSQIAEIVWGKETDYNDWALDQIMKRLRVKLGKTGLNPNLLKTRKGIGYQWEN